jgi:energy-coupling factor transporter ATP-binding protein EcfA2
MGLLLPERPGAAVPAPSDTAAEAAAGASRGGPLVVARGLEFSYPGNEAFRLAVSNLEVRGGEVVAVIGANGSGKTTLGRILCGLLRPVGGTVSIALKSGLVPASSEQLNRYTGYLFQDPDLQIFLPTVADELSYGLRLQGLDTEAQRASVADAVERFQLPSPEAPPALLSYGARKRLQAAVCYLLPRPLLVVDEGDSGLGASEFAELLRQLQAPGRGLLFITHDLELAENLSDRVLRMREGTLE